MHKTLRKRYRHLNFFQHVLPARVLPGRSGATGSPARRWEPPGRPALGGELSGLTLRLEALILLLCQAMPFAAVARLVGESWHRAAAIAQRYVAPALEQGD